MVQCHQSEQRLYFTMNHNTNKLKYSLYGLFLRGTVVDLCKVFSMDSVEPLVDVIAIGLFLFGVIELLKQEVKFVFYSTLLFGLLWGLSTYIHPSNTVYVKENLAQFFIYCLPFMWIGYYFIKHSVYLEILLPIAKIKLVLALIVQAIILINPSRDIFGGDYQTAAYSIIVGLLSTYYLALRNKKKIDIFLSILGTLILMICGSRGIFVSLIFFWSIYFISQTNNKQKITIMVSMAILFSFFSFQQIIAPIAAVAESFGFSTHLTDALAQGAVFEDENRELLYTGFWALIWQEPLGYGIMGDRYISYYTGIFWKPIYPHNIFLELMVDFGYVIGIVLSALLVYYIAKNLLFCKNTKYMMVLLILTSTSLIKLLFASSFWIDQMFFMLIGALVARKFVIADKNSL